MGQNESEEGKEPRLHVDQDWKRRVAEERERLREKEEEKKREERGRTEALPEANFQVFLAGLYTQTLVALGLVENPVSGKKVVRLDEAQYLIDTISMLGEKTKGNLTEEESTYLDNLLYDLRMRYIEVSRTGPAERKPDETP